MRSNDRMVLLIVAAGVLLTLPAAAQTALSNQGIKFPDGSIQTTAGGDSCVNPSDPADEMVLVGGACIDKYEASVWSEPDGGIQYGVTGDDYPCADNGQDCADEGKRIYARSIPGVQPSAYITWFQAAAALANSGKRLPHNIEWQQAVQGTPDNTNCNVSTGSVSNAGVFGNCVSDWNVFDMVGNLWEWVADWVPASSACPGWGTVSDDYMCLSGASTTTRGPGAVIRGGHFLDFEAAGPFAILGDFQTSDSFSYIGFRGARE